MRTLALIAIVPACATAYFFVFWQWFAFWRAHRALAYTLMIGTVVASAVIAVVLADELLVVRVAMPTIAQVVGCGLIAAACVLGFVADRQIGIRVRSFMPFFDRAGRIDLSTDGAYGIVRHPIYASGIYFQLGTFLLTGYVAVVIALAILALGALWFTRQEERRLVELLSDPADYERYRRRVPALLPWPR